MMCDLDTFGSHSVTDISAVRFALKLAQALIGARPFEVEAALIVARDLANHAPPYLLTLAREAEAAILEAQDRPDSRHASVARERFDHFVAEMELHEFAEQPASRN